jgi:hypothetical protein
MKMHHLLAVCALLMDLSAAAAEVHQVPFIVGLTTTKTVSETRGDYESVQMLQEIKRDSFTLVRSGEVPDDSGEVQELSITRQVRLQDLRNSRSLRLYFHTSDPVSLPPSMSPSSLIARRRAGSAVSKSTRNTVFGNCPVCWADSAHN